MLSSRRRGIRRGPSCSVCINVGVIERYEERFSTFGLTSLDLATKGDIDNPTVVVASVRFTMVHQGNETIAPVSAEQGRKLNDSLVQNVLNVLSQNSIVHRLSM